MNNMQANLRQIVLHEAKPNVKAQASTAVTRGFEACAYPKIVRELKDEQLIVRQKALLAARELLGSPTGHIQCIAAGISPALVELLKDPDALVRERAAGTIEMVVGKEVGARDVLQHQGIQSLVKCLKDVQDSVRDASYVALIEASRFDCVRKDLCQQAVLGELLEQGLNEPKYTLKSLLVLNAAVQVRHNDLALEMLISGASAIPSLASLIEEHQPPNVQEQAAILMGVLTSYEPEYAKVQAVKVGSVPKLLRLLRAQSIHVVSAAATALMNITVCRDGKYAVVNEPNSAKAIADLLNPYNPEVCVKATEIVTNVAEAPEARPLFLEANVGEKLNAIHQLQQVPDVLKRSAAQAIRQCGFKYLPFSVLPGQTLKVNEDGTFQCLPMTA